MQDILKSLSDFHNSQVEKLTKENSQNSQLITSLKTQIQSLKEENMSNKLIISEMLGQVKELESYKSLYFSTLENLKELQNNFSSKQNSWNKFKEKIKQKIIKKKSMQESQESHKVIHVHDQITPDETLRVAQTEITQRKKTEESKENEIEIIDRPKFKVSKLMKGANRDLSVAESMPWAQKQKDIESRPDYAYTDVVRKKDERKRLHAGDCPCCKDFYEACGLPKVVEHEGRMVDRIQLVSRHRFVHKDPDTPEGYWDLDYNALYSTDEEKDTKEGKRKRLDAIEAQKKSKLSEFF